ncbi:hypothetical protein ThidrDRAFT_3604 [Thiorhodococcus drewsii AZ1]|uniref:Uncharacterized protein n=1 Tax=Thiorhodococcus drewsii AZ1 TaxID=765913 RepID=G2E5P1_9GAMM|nr:hypothetical protein ThidrDRAFT_3604 [Thiorhodococcus drewsii AZ1]
MWKMMVSRDALPELPPKAAQLLASFLSVADGSMSHPNDARRFYRFVRHCHARRVRLSDTTLEAILLRVGCVKAQAASLAEAYRHGRNVLNTR